MNLDKSMNIKIGLSWILCLSWILGLNSHLIFWNLCIMPKFIKKKNIIIYQLKEFLNM